MNLCKLSLGRSWAVLFGLWTALAVNGAPPRPNIILIVTDDQGVWDLRSAGNPYIDTPVLDRLAAQGVSFENFYVQPVCAPTRAGLLTGRYYLRTGLYNTRFGGDSMNLNEITVAQRLKQAGYRTGIFGKWHLGRYHGYQPNQRGFDEFLGFYEGHLERQEYADQLVHNGRQVETRGYVTDLFTDGSLEFMEQVRREGGAPFFCYLAFNAPHVPHLMETSSNNQKAGDLQIDKYLKRGVPLTEARLYAQVERVDQNIGRIQAYLEERGLAENTLILFMSDNGGVSRFWKGGLRGNKATTYEGGVRSPLLAVWPRQFPAGTKVAAVTSHVDLMPTFCDLAGITVPADRPVDGRSLLPLLQAGKGDRHHDFVYATWNRFKPDASKGWGIRDQRYAMVGMAQKNQAGSEADWELFDLVTDPGQEKNIIAEYPHKARELRGEFLRWFGEVTDGQSYVPVPIPVGYEEENPVELQASWASTYHGTPKYVFEAYDWDTIEGWSQPGEGVEWQLDVVTGGRYRVTIAYGCRGPDAGGHLKISSGGNSLEVKTVATPTPEVFQRVVVGELTLKPGRATLQAEVKDCPGAELMRLNRIWLEKLP